MSTYGWVTVINTRNFPIEVQLLNAAYSPVTLTGFEIVNADKGGPESGAQIDVRLAQHTWPRAPALQSYDAQFAEQTPISIQMEMSPSHTCIIQIPMDQFPIGDNILLYIFENSIQMNSTGNRVTSSFKYEN